MGSSRCAGVCSTPCLAVYLRHPVWTHIIDEGFFNTITPTFPGDRIAMTEAFWYSVGSFGVPLLLLGSLVTRLSRRGERVPVWLGCGIASWAVLVGLLGGFDTGTMILLLSGVLLAVGALGSCRVPVRWARPGN